MTKLETLEKLCILTTRVGHHFNHVYAYDCFCGQNPLSEKTPFKMESEIIQFIEQAIAEKIQREKK